MAERQTEQVRLTDAEREALRRAIADWAPVEEWDAVRSGSAFERVPPVVERIVAERLAPIVALADEWESDYPGPRASCDREVDEWWLDLRAALAPLLRTGMPDGGEG